MAWIKYKTNQTPLYKENYNSIRTHVVGTIKCPLDTVLGQAGRLTWAETFWVRNFSSSNATKPTIVELGEEASRHHSCDPISWIRCTYQSNASGYQKGYQMSAPQGSWADR